MKTGLTISTLAHAALLLWGLISFAARPLEAAPTDALPVDIISEKQYSELTKGVKNAPKVEETKPPVEKIDEPRPADDAVAKIANKQEIKTASEPPPPPLPEPRPAEAKPEKKPPPQVDQIAEALKKEEAKKRAEAKAKAKAEQQRKQQPKFDPNQIAALLDKRDSQRLAAAGEALAPAPASLGVRSGSAAKLSQSELDALRARLMQLWNPPAGVQNPEELIVKVRIQLSRDGRLAGPPMVLTSGRGVMFESARDSAIRALFRGQPFNMLSPSTYDLWKEIEITFDPRDMFQG
jgi:colicin import membrane protein